MVITGLAWPSRAETAIMGTRSASSVDVADAEVNHQYSLTDYLFADPKPLPHGGYTADSIHIEMTNQEAAVARSHIAVWKLVAEAAMSAAAVWCSIRRG